MNTGTLKNLNQTLARKAEPCPKTEPGAHPQPEPAKASDWARTMQAAVSASQCTLATMPAKVEATALKVAMASMLAVARVACHSVIAQPMVEMA